MDPQPEILQGDKWGLGTLARTSSPEPLHYSQQQSHEARNVAHAAHNSSRLPSFRTPAVPSPEIGVEMRQLRAMPVQEQCTPSSASQKDAQLNSVERQDTATGPLNMAEDLQLPHLVAINTAEFERYNRAYCYPERYYEPGEPTIDAFTTSFEGLAPPEGWKVFTHPEGARYFYCDSPANLVPVVTDAWIYDEDQRSRIERYMAKIFGYMVDRRISFPRYHSPAPRRRRQTRSDSVHFNSTLTNGPFGDSYPQHLAPIVLVLDTRLTGNMGYYFVSHPTQTIFWLDPFDYSMAVGEVHTDYTQTLVGLEMKRHYWMHNDLFPHLYELEESDIEEVDDMVGFALGDVLTSLTGTTMIFSQEQLKQIEHIIHRYDTKRWVRKRKSVGERRFIYRILGDFYHERFLNLYGERGARLNSTQSIHYSSCRRKKYVSGPQALSRPQAWYKRFVKHLFKAKPRHECDNDEISVEADDPIHPNVIKMHRNSPLMKILSLAMLGGPGVHMKRLRDMTVDRIVNRNILTKYIEKMMEEWRDVTLYGTVLLGVNVSLLTIQSVDDAGKGTQRTGSQRASYFSIMASIGTIVSSFMLMGRHREVMNYTFIVHRSNTRWGLESLALMYGTPFSLAIWSTISFFTAFAILWLSHKDHVVMGLVGSFSFIFAFFLIWAILAPYENQPYQFFVSTAVERMRRVREKVGRGSLKAIRSLAKRGASSAEDGSAAVASPSDEVAKSLTNTIARPTSNSTRLSRDTFPPDTRTYAPRAFGAVRRTWGESVGTVVQACDSDDPCNVMKGLDTGQISAVVQGDRARSLLLKGSAAPG